VLQNSYCKQLENSSVKYDRSNAEMHRRYENICFRFERKKQSLQKPLHPGMKVESFNFLFFYNDLITTLIDSHTSMALELTRFENYW